MDNWYIIALVIALIIWICVKLNFNPFIAFIELLVGIFD